MNSIIFDKILKEMPLKNRIKGALEAYFIEKNKGTFFIHIDENGNENIDAINKNNECLKEAKPLIDLIFKEIDEWKNDGSFK